MNGRVALIVGASRGIGRATSFAVAERGASVIVAARSLAACEAVVAELGAAGHEASAAAADIGDYAAVSRLVEATLARFGRVDVLVNSAATIDPIGPLAATAPEEWAESLRINLLGAYHCVRAVLPTFERQGGGTVVNVSSGGTVVNVSSGAAVRPLEGWSAYCSGKAGLAMLTRSLHLEMGPAGVRAFSFQPGTVDTEMQGKIRASGVNPVSAIPRGALTPPEVPAAAIAWLCTDEAAYLAGRELSIKDDEFARFRS